MRSLLLQIKMKQCNGIFTLPTSLRKRLVCLEYCRHSPKSEVKKMTVTARSKHSNPGEDVCIVKQNNPNNPSHTEARETKSKILPPPSLLR